MKTNAFGRLSTGVALLAVVGAAGVATAQVVRTTVDLSAGGGYSTNPFLLLDDGEDTGSLVIEGQVRPQLRLIEERGETTLAGYLRHQQYLSRYDASTNFGASANHASRLSERLTVRAGVQIDSGILGGAQFDTPIFTPIPSLPGATPFDPAAPPPTGLPLLPLDPTQPTFPIVIDPSLGDIGLLGTRARRTTYGGNIGLEYTPSVRDNFAAGFSAQRSGYDRDLVGADYNQYIGNASYSRQLSENLQLGVQGLISRVDYDDSTDATIFQPQLTFGWRLSPAWAVNGGIGAAFTKIDSFGPFPSDNRTTLSGNLSACRTQPLSSFCFTGARSSAPSGFGGVQNFTSVGATYRLQLAERDGIYAEAAYSRTDDSVFDFPGQDLVTASVGWSRQLDERLRLNATVGYRDAFTADIDRSADFSGLVSIGYTLGDRQ